MTKQKTKKETSDLRTALRNVERSVEQFAQTAGSAAGKASKGIETAAAFTIRTASHTAEQVQKKVLETMDENENREVDIEDVIAKGLRIRGISIKREAFLRKALHKRVSEAMIQDAILHTPSHAGIPRRKIDQIADHVIHQERNLAAGTSAALGAPGGLAMVATIPADVLQVYGYLIRTAQKLLYLYGFPEINVNETEEGFDPQTVNLLTLCLGVMYGTEGVPEALKAYSGALQKGVDAKCLSFALTEGALVPTVERISSFSGSRMKKDVLSNVFLNAVPIAGSVMGGEMTYLSFKPGCVKLKKTLRDTALANPLHVADLEETLILRRIESSEE